MYNNHNHYDHHYHHDNCNNHNHNHHGCKDDCVTTVSVSVPVVANTSNITLLSTQPFIDAKTEAILYISDMNNLLQDEYAIISINDTVNTLPLEDKRGYNVRADRLVSRLYKMPNGLPGNSTMAIKVTVATDPARIICLTPLGRSADKRPATTAGTATGTGINLD